MLTHPTLDQLHQLGRAGMARAFTELEANPQSADLSHAEWLALLRDREATERYQRRLRARLRYAWLRHQASVEDVDYRAARGLDRSPLQALIAGRWIEEAQNLHEALLPAPHAELRNGGAAHNLRRAASLRGGKHPPANSLVLPVDAKSQIQALDRTRPGLQMNNGRRER